MAFDYNELAAAAVEAVRSQGQWHRAVSIDLETKIEKKEDFLTGERLLGIGLARRAEGKVETKTFILKDESDEAEIELLYEAARWLAPVRPLILLGYNIAGYDYPLLNMKLKWHDDLLRAAAPEGEKPRFPREYWALKDAATRACVLDMLHPLRYALAEHDGTTPKYKSLADVVSHARFEKVALMRRKQLAQGETSEHKGKIIYDLWRAHNPDFARYLEGDVHDVLLLAEELYGVGRG
jgi:DNA polymerase elongation subunit (family B)